jgi:hypothetical protein
LAANTYANIVAALSGAEDIEASIAAEIANEDAASSKPGATATETEPADDEDSSSEKSSTDENEEETKEEKDEPASLQGVGQTVFSGTVTAAVQEAAETQSAGSATGPTVYAAADDWDSRKFHVMASHKYSKNRVVGSEDDKLFSFGLSGAPASNSFAGQSEMGTSTNPAPSTSHDAVN